MYKCTNTCGIPTTEGVRLFVLTGNYQVFRDWCKKHGLSPMDAMRVMCLLQPRQAMGLRYAEGRNAFILGDLWHDARHGQEIFDRMVANGFEPLEGCKDVYRTHS